MVHNILINGENILPQPSDITPKFSEKASVFNPGTLEEYARADHVHPTSDAYADFRGAVTPGQEICSTTYNGTSFAVIANTDGLGRFIYRNDSSVSKSVSWYTVATYYGGWVTNYQDPQTVSPGGTLSLTATNPGYPGTTAQSFTYHKTMLVDKSVGIYHLCELYFVARFGTTSQNNTNVAAKIRQTVLFI